MAFRSANDPEAIPDIIAACSRGNAYDPTFNATIWNPPPMNAAHEMISMASMTEFVQVVNPNASANTVSNANSPTGRRLSAAYLSATQPHRKYPMPQASGG